MSPAELLILSTFVVWITVNVVIAGRHKTISQVMRDTAWKYSSFAALFGTLCSHWFFTVKVYPSSSFFHILPFFGGLLLWDAFWGQIGTRVWYRHPIIGFCVGLVLGVLYWPQTGY